MVSDDGTRRINDTYAFSEMHDVPDNAGKYDGKDSEEHQDV